MLLNCQTINARGISEWKSFFQIFFIFPCVFVILSSVCDLRNNWDCWRDIKNNARNKLGTSFFWCFAGRASQYNLSNWPTYCTIFFFFIAGICHTACEQDVWHTPLLCVQWKTPDDGQRNCPKHVDFYSKNKFKKLVHLVGFIIRIYRDVRSHEPQMRCPNFPLNLPNHSHSPTAMADTRKIPVRKITNILIWKRVNSKLR